MPKKPYSLVGYIPVLHQGYIQFLRQHQDADCLYIIDADLIAEEDYLRKELRAVSPERMVAALKALNLVGDVRIVNKKTITELDAANQMIVLPDEDISHGVAEGYLRSASTSFYPVFLRWDRRNVEGLNQEDEGLATTDAPADVDFMKQAFEIATSSPDIWRHVGAVLVLDGAVYGEASNQPLTTQNTPWAEGDPRGVFKRGVGIEMSTFMHAEARLIADAARDGTSLKGAALYVTTFPCPACAMLMAECGLSACYFAEGYAVLDGLRVMQEAGVDVSRVAVQLPEDDTRGTVPYPEKK